MQTFIYKFRQQYDMETKYDEKKIREVFRKSRIVTRNKLAKELGVNYRTAEKYLNRLLKEHKVRKLEYKNKYLIQVWLWVGDNDDEGVEAQLD